MTITEVTRRITERGFTVDCKPVSPDGSVYALAVLDAQGNSVAWPNITVGKNGNVSDVAIPSFHGGKITGLGDYPTAAIYADVYLSHEGRPSQAEKVLANMFAAPASTRELAQAAALATV